MPDMEELKRKVLVVTHSFPPSGTSATQRPLKFTKYLARFGWQPYVLTSKRKRKPLDLELVKEIPRGVVVKAVSSFEPVNGEFGIIAMSDQICDGRWGRAIVDTVLKILLKVYSVIYHRLVIVDWYDGWIPFAVAKGTRIISEENIDVIYVHGEPPSSFVIGLILKRITGKPLVIDYDDSWTTSVYGLRQTGFRRRIRRRLEKTVLQAAERVVSVKRVTIDEIRKCFGDVREEKCHLIPNGYDPEDFERLSKRQNEKFTVTYTGRISDKFYYSPETFLKALCLLINEGRIGRHEISVIFLGTISSRYQERFEGLIDKLALQNVVQNLGYLGHRECIRAQVDADLLLYIIESLDDKELSYEFAGVMPAKLFEYIRTGVPILAIVPPGPEADLIIRTNTGFITNPNDVDSVAEVLGEIIQRYKQNRLAVMPKDKEISKYNRVELTRRMGDVFQKAMEDIRGAT